MAKQKLKRILAACFVLTLLGGLPSQNAEASCFAVRVDSFIEEDEEPLKIKKFSITNGEILDVSHKEEDILEKGKPFYFKADIKSRTELIPSEYISNLEKEGKFVDYFEIGNDKKSVKFYLQTSKLGSTILPSWSNCTTLNVGYKGKDMSSTFQIHSLPKFL